MNGGKKGCVCRMVDKEEYKKVHDVLCRSSGKISEVRLCFSYKYRDMMDFDDTFHYDIGIVDVLKELQNVYKTLDAFRCSNNVSKYVSYVPPEYEIENPVIRFHERDKEGAYLDLSFEEYNRKINNIEAMSFHSDVKDKAEYVHLDVRDAYLDAMKAVSDLQSALKKIYDSALFVSMIGPFFTEQYFELNEYDREQLDKIPDDDWEVSDEPCDLDFVEE